MSFSLQIKQNNTDEWYTPRDAVELIVPYLQEKRMRKVLCPFDKADSNFVKVLGENGFAVSYSHIETGTDFFKIDNLQGFDAIVSNPPFSKRQKILERLFGAGVPFAMVMNFNGLFDNRKRWELFKANEFELLVPCGRVKYFNETCKGNSPQFQSVYVCHGILSQQIVFDAGNRQ